MLNNLRRIPASVWLLGLIVLGLAIRLGAIDAQSLWRDEVDAIRFGRDLSAQIRAALSGGGFNGLLDELRRTLTQPGFNGPLYFLALAQWAGVLGDSAYALRIFSTFFGVLAIPLTYVLTRRFFNYTGQGPALKASGVTQVNREQHGSDSASALSAPTRAPGSSLSLLAAWLATISPYFVWYSQEAKMYTEITALALAAIYGLRRAVAAPDHRRSAPWWLLVVAATTLAMYSHIFAALLIGVEVALFLLWWPSAKRHWPGGLSTLAALTLPYLPLVGWQLPLALTPGDQGFAFYPFDQILRVMLSGFANGVLPFEHTLSTIGVRWNPDTFSPDLTPTGWSMGLLSVLVILGALMWKAADDRAHRIGLAAWVLLPAAVIALISLNRPVFTDRYLIWIGPAVYLLAALGIAELWKWHKALGSVALLLISLAAAVSLYAQAVTPFKADFRSAARHVAARYQGEAILFQIPYGRYTFDYYFGPSFQALEGPYTNRRNADGSYERDTTSFDIEIANSMQGQRAVWLAATEVEMWDERHLLEDWLNRHGRVTDRADFTRVTVTRYELQ